MCGGAATNVVMPEIKLQGEARSHSPSFRDRIVREFRKAFEHAVSSVDSSDGSTAQLTFEEDTRYTAFRIPRSSPCVRTAVAAVRAAGLTPETPVSSGGLDANWMTVHGFPTVTLGCGQHQIHTVGERLSIPQYIQACSIAADIAAGIE